MTMRTLAYVCRFVLLLPVFAVLFVVLYGTAGFAALAVWFWFIHVVRSPIKA